MKLFFKKYVNEVKNSKMFGKWYARVAITETVGIEEIAVKMQDSCTLKRADILAVLSELGPTVRDLLQDSKRVKLPYLGSFKLAISTTGADSAEAFTASNVKSVRVAFQPETHISADKHRVKELTSGCRLMELPEYGYSKGEDVENND
ncbi:DNA-binding protein [Prevotella sp. E13-17]|uniref:HU family DNA-binding protein n=1 Tax=Prevotella sp. E13-17 TaxID=2913616 RepID=UPI001EDC49F9|nr:HU family DNA-binding protein [Prevotella sp. E13-17]UKK51036.1 DNA-binding protein [Prevotella sp. E13-17]